jgi:hypothetical protein
LVLVDDAQFPFTQRAVVQDTYLPSGAHLPSGAYLPLGAYLEGAEYIVSGWGPAVARVCKAQARVCFREHCGKYSRERHVGETGAAHLDVVCQLVGPQVKRHGRAEHALRVHCERGGKVVQCKRVEWADVVFVWGAPRKCVGKLAVHRVRVLVRHEQAIVQQVEQAVDGGGARVDRL